MDDDRIDRAALEELFSTIRERTDWPIDGEMLWGYFFVDADRDKLARAAHELERAGYRVVGILTRDDDDDASLYLHVERVEAHTVDSLEQRNAELYTFAAKLGLETYDGMDVGPVQWS